jgi:hypothetical protein
MRLRLVMAVVVSSAATAALAAGVAALGACSSSSSSGSTSDAGDAAPPCSDPNGFGDLYSNTQGAFCPTDPSGDPTKITYDQAKEELCACHGYDPNSGACVAIDAGHILAGPCNDYLVYEYIPPGNAGYTKCFYRTSDRMLVGISFSDGTMDQCGNTSSVILGGTTEDYCGFGHYDVNQNCAPKPEAGADGATDGGTG